MASPKLSPELAREALQAFNTHGSISGAAKALNLPVGTYKNRLNVARMYELSGYPETTPETPPPEPIKLRPGAATAREPIVVPPSAATTRYIVTCAQSDTEVHADTFSALLTLANHYRARLCVSTFTYVHAQEGSEKRGAASARRRATASYDPRIEPYIMDDMLQVAPSLVINGHVNILPTAEDPLAGMHAYNGRQSSIFPHAKQHMSSVAAVRPHNAKLQYTTGAVTGVNYIQKKAGQKAEPWHVLGGLIVEVCPDGVWFVRQLRVVNGEVRDLDICAHADGTIRLVSGLPAAIVFGDVHASLMSEDRQEQLWGDDGVVASLLPSLQVMHDVFDCQSVSHHKRNRPHERFEDVLAGRSNLHKELQVTADLVRKAAEWSRVYVVDSNHDRHLERWLAETDWRDDLENAEIHLEAQSAWLAAIRRNEPFHALAWYIGDGNGVEFLSDGKTAAFGGYRLELHGDRGADGARGSRRNLARVGTPCVIGHSHSAGMFQHVVQVGVAATLDMAYARGAPSSWTMTDAVIHDNGAPQLITWYAGRWRG